MGDLAEFIIDLANKNKTLAKFKAALLENGAEFSDSFIDNLLRIIQHMTQGDKVDNEEQPRPNLALLREQLPCLAIPDNVKAEEKEKEGFEEDTGVDSMMEFLESMAPSKAKVDDDYESKQRDRSRSKSRERGNKRDRRRSRDRSRERKRKSRSRSRDRRRSRSKDRKRKHRTEAVVRAEKEEIKEIEGE